MEKKKDLWVIPTDKPSKIGQSIFDKSLHFNPIFNYKLEKEGVIPQNIFITSDEEIKEGDKDFYIIANDRDKTWINRLEKVVECKIDPKHGKVLILFSETFLWVDEGKKIILTTDQDLINDGVQAIDYKFLEWFVHNPSCEWVEVKKGKMKLNDDGEEYGFPDMSLYKIIIPKEPKF